MALFWGLGIGLGLAVIGVLSDVSERELLVRIGEGGQFFDEELSANDIRQGLVGVAQLIVFVVTLIFWLRWFSRAYKNLPSLGAQHLRFSPGWAVGAWFVPFLNLFRPKAMTDDTWRASDPNAPPVQGDAWREKRVTPLLHWWWALFILSAILGNFLFRMAFGEESETIEGLLSFNLASILSNFLDIPLSILAILVVREITGRQMTRAHRLQLGTAPSSQLSDWRP